MDAAILLQLSHSSSPHHQPLHYNLFGDRVADRNTLAAHSSFVRSSAPRQMPQYTSQFLPSSFRSTYSMASSSSGSGSFVAGGSRVGSPYEVSDAELHTPAPQTYHAEQYPSASSSWPQQVDQSQPPQYAADPYTSTSYELADNTVMHSPAKTEDPAHIEPYSLYLPSYTDHIHGTNPLNDQHPPLAASYNVATGHFQPTDSTTQPQMGYGYGNHEHQHQQSGAPDVANISPYMLSNDTALQYSDYQDGDMPRFVHPAQVSPPSPFAQLQDVGPQGQSCDPRFTVNPMHGFGSSGASPSDFTDFDLDSGSTSGGDSPSLVVSAPIPVPPPGARKRQRSVSFTSSSDDEYHASSGESEQGEGDDDDYVQSPRTRRQRRQQQHGDYPAAANSPSTSPGAESLGGGRRLAPPVPVPNLTKKSRGRRVPTVQQVGDGGMQKQRMYMCKVPGCGKCFARGEHLKRHVRSIHTNDKPHKCPYPGCGKDFSRHDNLGQHMRVHKGFQMPKSGRL
ncbi:hypothetical protein LXA43DRAFT_1094997 [Ganoderma leucocontextum]|nr:hypothetical protein LXA43DRAFT_1094997 [Ganoderma leucocontextum]